MLELPPSDIPTSSINLIHWLRTRQITPIIVHPERNRSFQKRPEKLQPFLDAGCPLQITSSSIIGDFSSPIRQFATELLQQGKVALIATDCHNLKQRPPNLRQAINEAGEMEIIGHSQAEKLANPTALNLL